MHIYETCGCDAGTHGVVDVQELVVGPRPFGKEGAELCEVGVYWHGSVVAVDSWVRL